MLRVRTQASFGEDQLPYDFLIVLDNALKHNFENELTAMLHLNLYDCTYTRPPQSL